MRTNTLLFLLGLCGACFYAQNVQAAETPHVASSSSKARSSTLTTKEAIEMLQKYGIIDQYASGEIVSTWTNSVGKKYEQNPIKAISKDLLYHFMMYQDGVEEINDYPYIDTIIELYRRANTKQEELQSQGFASIADDMQTINQAFGEALLGETKQQREVKTLKKLPVRCLEAFAAEGGAVKDYATCCDNVIKVEPMDAKIMAFLSTKGIANAPHLLNVKNNVGWTPLMYAARYSTAEACKALIDAGANVNARDDAGWTPLMFAAGNPTGETLKIFISSSDVNAKANDGVTSLMIAAGNSAEACKVLLDAGANVNARSNDGWAPLMYAARYSTAEACKILLDAGANVNARSNDGWTPLMCAARDSTAEACKVLLDAGANVNAKAYDGGTALMFAAKNSAEACKVLIAAGADVNAKANNGATALMAAALGGSSSETFKVLIAAGADVNAKAHNGTTVLMMASGDSSADVCKTLIAAGADVNAKCNIDGRVITPLAFSVMAGNDDIVDLLLKNGADVQIDEAVNSDLTKAIFNPIVKEQYIKVFPNGRHNYREVRILLGEKKNKQ